MNATMQKFDYPETLIREFENWVVLLRPKQVTLGSLVLICKDKAASFSQISPKAFSELKEITTQLEATLTHCFAYDKINYLMLMMVDPDVHFHVLPRYARSQPFSGKIFHDPAFPGPPDLTKATETGSEINHAIKERIQKSWELTTFRASE